MKFKQKDTRNCIFVCVYANIIVCVCVRERERERGEYWLKNK